MSQKRRWLGRAVLCSLMCGAMCTSVWAAEPAVVDVGDEDITVDLYDWQQEKAYVFRHDLTTPTTILGGNVTIKASSIGPSEMPALVYLRTSAEGIDTTDSILVHNVLNNMANKLYYTAYTKGERKLAGRAEIMEQLTSPSMVKSFEMLAFKPKTGQAFVSGANVMLVGEDGITVDKYLFDQPQIYAYRHDAANPTKMLGGDILIKSAERSNKVRSMVVLRTDSDGIDMKNAETRQNVLNALANKLTYQAYVTGECNLKGQAEIAESLTAPKYGQRFSTLTFNETTGRAEAKEDLMHFTTAITGDKERDTEYSERNVLSQFFPNPTYWFRDHVVIAPVLDASGATGDPGNMKAPVGISSKEKGVWINLFKKDLTVNMNLKVGYMAQVWTAGIASNSGLIDIANPGAINLNTDVDYFYASGISAYSKDGGKTAGKVLIHNDNDPAHRVKVRGGFSSENIFDVNFFGLSTSQGGEIAIDGLVDIELDGGWPVRASSGKVSIGGGHLVSKHQSVLQAYSSGKVFLNVKENSADGTLTPGTNPVTLDGNILTHGVWVGNNSPGYISVAMTTPESGWTGKANTMAGQMIDGELKTAPIGKLVLWLQNGATWTNLDRGFRYGNGIQPGHTAESYVHSLVGGGFPTEQRGVIYQKDPKAIQIGEFTGNLTVLYDRDKADPTKLIGGGVEVEAAHRTDGKNAMVAMRTDADGLDVGNQETVNKVLSGLANLLTYKNYADSMGGERNLTGKAEIGEGLTSTSRTLKIGNIKFDNTTGQGSYTAGEIPEEQTETEFKTAITGDATADGEYHRGGTLKKDGSYDFIYDTRITADTASAKAPYFAVRGDHDGDVIVNLHNNQLQITSTAPESAAKEDLSGGVGAYKNGTVYLQNLKGLDVQNKRDSGAAYGLYAATADGTAKVIVENHSKQAVPATISGFDAAEMDAVYAGQNGTIDVKGGLTVTGKNGRGIVGDAGTVTVAGQTNVKLENGTVVTAAKGGTVELTGADLQTTKTALLADDGTIRINLTKEQEDAAYAPGKQIVAVKGDIATMQKGNIQMALNGADSTWDGGLTRDGEGGNLELWLQSGAAWTMRDAKTKGAARIDTLHAGTDGYKSGIFYQTGANDLTIDNYDGHLMAIYKRDAADPTAVVGGGITVVKAAKTGDEASYIRLRTDSDGLDLGDRTQLNTVLDNLAQKLTYQAYAQGERNLSGNVEIAEGLTAQAVRRSFGAISFDEQTGRGHYRMGSTMNSPITGDAARDKEYDGVRKDGTYTFTQDIVLRPQFDSLTPAGPMELFPRRQMAHMGAIYTLGDGDITLDMGGHNLLINMDDWDASAYTEYSNKRSIMTAIKAIDGKTVKILNPGNIHLELTSKYNDVFGIQAVPNADEDAPADSKHGGHVVIQNRNGWDHAVTLRAKPGQLARYNYKTLEAIRAVQGGTVNIDGWVDIVMDKKQLKGTDFNEPEANGISASSNSRINIGGGRLEVTDKAFSVGGGSVINFNMKEEGGVWRSGRSPVQVAGEALVNYTNSKLRLGLNGKGSFWHGRSVYGGDLPTESDSLGMDLYLDNGAQWQSVHISNMSYNGQYLHGLYAGTQTRHGVRPQEILYGDSLDTTIREFQGNAIVLYRFSTTDPVTGEYLHGAQEETIEGDSYQGQIIIDHALKINGENAKITMRRDRRDIDIEDEAAVKTALNNLARKLVYKGYVDGERNLDAWTEIAEGLTARSAACLKRGDIVFNEQTGRGGVKDGSVVTPDTTPKELPKVVNVPKDRTDEYYVEEYGKDHNQMYIYEHNEQNPTEIYGAGVAIGTAEEGSRITLRTDNSGIDLSYPDAKETQKLVSDVLDNLAHKLTYDGYVDGERNLAGDVEIAEGLTAASAKRSYGKIAFNETDGIGRLADGSMQIVGADIIYGPKETAMMRGVKSATGGAMLMWRAENNDLAKRLGELRMASGQDGVWGRLYGGKVEYDKSNVSYQSEFKAVQVGYDKALTNGWHGGVAFSYMDGDNSYPALGSGDATLASVALYGSKVADNGSYVDIVAKGSRLSSDYTVYNDMKHKLVGDYTTNGVTVSAEYGKRIDRANGAYITPQVELIYGRLAGSTYDAVSDYSGGKKMHVEQDSLTSLIGRVGVEYGKRDERTNMFVKLSALHEFKGETGATYSAKNEPISHTDVDFGDTWFVIGVGGAHQVSDSTYLYGNLERSFGGDFKEDWRADLGLRWMF